MASSSDAQLPDNDIPPAVYCPSCQQRIVWDLFFTALGSQSFSILPFDPLEVVQTRAKRCSFCQFILRCFQLNSHGGAENPHYGKPFVILEQCLVDNLPLPQPEAGFRRSNDPSRTLKPIANYRIFPRLTDISQVRGRDLGVFAAMITDKSLSSEFRHVASDKGFGIQCVSPLRLSNVHDPSLIIGDDHLNRLLGVEAAILSTKIPLKKINIWIEQCAKQHGDTCRPHSRSPRVLELPLRLIDVYTHAVVEGRSVRQNYTTLSYVWGNVDVLKHYRHNWASLSEAGALNSLRLPLTVRHAIEVTEQLGYRYLWVDALCIRQDDEEEKAAEIAKMGTIYSNSSLTIVALTGLDADAGLSGVGQCERSTRSSLANSSDSTLVTTFLGLETALDASPWSERGWTLQEQVLSTRCLFFGQHQLYFQCRTAIFSELDETLRSVRWDTDPMESSGRNPASVSSSRQGYPINNPQASKRGGTGTIASSSAWGRRQILPTTTALSQNNSATLEYLKIVEQYTKRKLTYPTDILNGFYGIVQYLTANMHAEFVLGIPVQILNRALLWRHKDGSPTRRTVSIRIVGKDSVSHARILRLPSWSWAGWAGDVDYQLAISNLVSPYSQFFEPSTDFYVVSEERPRLMGSTSSHHPWNVFKYRQNFKLSPSQKETLRAVDTMFLVCNVALASIEVECIDTNRNDQGLEVRMQGLPGTHVLYASQDWVVSGPRQKIDMFQIAESHNQVYVMLVKSKGGFWERLDVLALSKQSVRGMGCDWKRTSIIIG
ncbi:hypothetical protein PV11_10153 [Exophiala sideris]|uniref:Heterokaryon incompatibility domain-containing protein n=1 Tax=Exophiala sideris TaxID=1016849 RepID=A0A0D1YU84_9EURO|nr:hypothetical protein PV11_10153 [Exophiala sideris]